MKEITLDTEPISDPITKQQRWLVQEQWRRRAEQHEFNPKHKKFHDAQAHYFAGAMAAIFALTGKAPDAGWVFAVMRGEDLTKQQDLTEEKGNG